MTQRNTNERKEMLLTRRAEQRARVSGAFTTSPRTSEKWRMKSIGYVDPYIKLSDGRRIHPTKGIREVSAYEKSFT